MLQLSWPDWPLQWTLTAFASLRDKTLAAALDLSTNSGVRFYHD